MGTPRTRAVAHVHSTWSYDGTLTLDELAHLFGRLRYRAVLLTEHDRGFTEARWADYQRACSAASTADVELVPGIEYSDAGNDVHVLVWGCDRFLGERRATSELLIDVRAARGVAVLAHPARRDAGARLSDEAVGLLDGVEVWNRKYDGIAPSRAAATLRARAGHLRPFVGLDLHTRRQLFPLTTLLPGTARLDRPAIFSALRDYRYAPETLRTPAVVVSGRAGIVALRPAERARRVTLDHIRSVRSR